jgi:hypothetical protein
VRIGEHRQHLRRVDAEVLTQPPQPVGVAIQAGGHHLLDVGDARQLLQSKRPLTEARWGSKPLAFAGKPRPRRLNNSPFGLTSSRHAKVKMRPQSASVQARSLVVHCTRYFMMNHNWISDG